MQEEPQSKSHSNRKSFLIGVALVLTSAVSWGFSGACAQFLSEVQHADVNWITSIRMLLAGTSMMAFCLCRSKNRNHIKSIFSSKKHTAHIVLYAVFGVFACQYTYLMTISYTNAGTGTMMEQLSQILTMFFGCLIARRLPKKRELIALVLALSGAFCLCTQGDPTSLAMPMGRLIWGLLSAVTMTTYVLIPVSLIERFDGTTISSLATFIAGIVMFPILRPWECAPAITMPVVLGILGSVVFGTLIAYTFFLEGIKRTGPIVASLLDSFEPVFAIIFSAVWLSTSVSIWDVVGCALIIAMIILIVYQPKSERESL